MTRELFTIDVTSRERKALLHQVKAAALQSHYDVTTLTLKLWRLYLLEDGPRRLRALQNEAPPEL